MERNDANLPTVYRSVVDEQHRYLDRLQSRVRFYTGLLTTVIGGSLVGFVNLGPYPRVAVVVIGGILVYLTAALAQKGIRRTYRLFSECISTRHKIEHDLGLDLPRFGTSERERGDWVERAPYVASRHLRSRKDSEFNLYASTTESEKAIQKKSSSYRGITNVTFAVAQIIAAVMVILGFLFLALHVCGITIDLFASGDG